MRVHVLAILLVLTVAYASNFYVETAVATGITEDEAKDRAIRQALSRIAGMISVEVAVETLREVRYEGKDVEEKYMRKVKTKSEVVIEGYNVEVIYSKRKNGYFEVSVRVEVPKEAVRESLKKLSILSLAETLYEGGYLSGANELLEKNRGYFSKGLWSKKFGEVYLKIKSRMDKLRSKMENAGVLADTGRILSYMRVVKDVLDSWRDIPERKEILENLRTMTAGLEISVEGIPERMLVLSDYRMSVGLYLNGKRILDEAIIDLETSDGNYTVRYNGATSTTLISPQYVRKDYEIVVDLSGIVKKAIKSSVGVLENRRDLKGCYVRATFPSFTDLPVGKKSKFLIVAPPKTWVYLFDYDDRKKTLKLMMERRMTNKGKIVLSVYFDEPTGDFYEGAVVLFSENPIEKLKEGYTYNLQHVREVLRGIEWKTSTDEILYRVVER